MKKYKSIFKEFTTSKTMNRHKDMIMDFAIKECDDSTFVRKLNEVLDDVLSSFEEELLNK